MAEQLLFTDAQRAQFDERGYAYLGQVLDDDELGALQARIDAIMLGEVPYDNMRFQLDSEDGVYGHTPPETVGHKGPTLSYRKIMDLEQDPLFLRYMQHPYFRQITDHYIGESVSIFRAMFMNKPAERGTEVGRSVAPSSQAKRPPHHNGSIMLNLSPPEREGKGRGRPG